jgi:hypothetical protein
MVLPEMNGSATAATTVQLIDEDCTFKWPSFVLGWDADC